MYKPYLSIIIACYNAEDYIECAIKSIVDQPFESIELIIVNDGSTDETDNICKRYCIIDDRIKYYRTDNLGAGHARNYGLTKASGKWISYLDSDDLYLSDAINGELISKLQLYESQDIDIIFTPWCRADMLLREHVAITMAKAEVGVIPELAFWTCFYYRDFLIKNEINFYEYRAQDVETAFRYLAVSKAKNVITDNEIRFYLQRENKNSNTNTWNVQVLHAVKCQIYYDLFINHSTSKAYWHLVTTFLREMECYYDSCISFGILDLNVLKKVHAIRKEVFTKYRKIVLLSLGRRKYIKLFTKAIISNSVFRFKHYPKVESKMNNKVQMDADMILRRLNKISVFLLPEKD